MKVSKHGWFHVRPYLQGYRLDDLLTSYIDQSKQTEAWTNRKVSRSERKKDRMHSKDRYAIRTIDLLVLSPWRPVIYKPCFIHSRFICMFRFVIKFDIGPRTAKLALLLIKFMKYGVVQFLLYEYMYLDESPNRVYVPNIHR